MSCSVGPSDVVMSSELHCIAERARERDRETERQRDRETHRERETHPCQHKTNSSTQLEDESTDGWGVGSREAPPPISVLALAALTLSLVTMTHHYDSSPSVSHLSRTRCSHSLIFPTRKKKEPSLRSVYESSRTRALAMPCYGPDSYAQC